MKNPNPNSNPLFVPESARRQVKVIPARNVKIKQECRYRMKKGNYFIDCPHILLSVTQACGLVV
jgi:hypothetical protein